LALAYWCARLDRVLVGLALLFAFTIACFPVANSDFFQHLASGRLLASGEYRFGHDPFSFTSEGAYWANNSWLYDLALYGLYSIPVIGGELIVLLKGLLLAAVAGLMILAGRKQGESPWVSCGFALLGVLVLSPRLLLQPTCISYLFLALTWWLLQQTSELTGDLNWKKQIRLGGALVLLFAAWANLDAFFLLGPLTAGLYALGEWVQDLATPSSRRQWAPSVRVRVLLAVTIGGLFACLANPHFVRAFELPWQLGLSPAAGALGEDYEFRILFASPLDELYLKSRQTLNAAGLAYFLLVVLGLCSFAVNYERLRWSRLLVWLVFFALSLANHRMIPFFAIVAASISALNFLDFSARIFSEAVPRLKWPYAPLAARAGVLAAGALLLLAAIPGWLQASPESRRVGLGVRIDPSLRQVALQVNSWLDEGVIGPDERLFATTPDVAAYLAWFAPRAEGFLDLRLSLFSESAPEYVAVRANLVAPPDAGVPAAVPREPAWRSVFAKRKISYLIAHLRDSRNLASRAVANRLFRSPDGVHDEWTVCYLDGRTVIARWNGQGKGHVAEVNAERLAFGADATPIPSTVESLPRASKWWSAVWKPGSRPLAADEAFLHFTQHEVQRERFQAQNQQAWESALAASIAGSAANPGSPLANGVLMLSRIDLAYRLLHGAPGDTQAGNMDRLAEQLLLRHLSSRGSGSTASLYLALRAARRSLAEQPDADTHYLLAQVYSQLAWMTGEQEREQPVPHLALLRQAQATASLQEALRLDPDHERAHELLAEWARRGMLFVRPFMPSGGRQPPVTLLQCRNVELELAHRREALRCARKYRPAAQLARMEQQVEMLEATVGKLLDQVEVTAHGKPSRFRAEVALERGLVETALKALLEAEEEKDPLSPTRPARVVELLLASGRVEEAVARLASEDRRSLGTLHAPLNVLAAAWFHLLASAATGDYEGADGTLAALLAAPQTNLSSPSGVVASMVAHQLLWEAPLAAGQPWQIVRTSPALIAGLPKDRRTAIDWALQQAGALLEAQTDLALLRGCLALESGTTVPALRHFRQVLVRCQVRQAGDRKGSAQSVILMRGLPLSLRHAARLEANGTRPDRPETRE
jgi:hypothetical protein